MGWSPFRKTGLTFHMPSASAKGYTLVVSRIAQSTALVVEGLFRSARRSVIVGGYAFDKPNILRPLHAAMKEHGRGTLYLTVRKDSIGTPGKTFDVSTRSPLHLAMRAAKDWRAAFSLLH